MKIKLQIDYNTNWGQTIYVCGSNALLGNWNEDHAAEMIYSPLSGWSIELNIEKNDIIEYRYLVKEQGQIINREWGNPHILKVETGKSFEVQDIWKNMPQQKFLYTSGFSEIPTKPDCSTGCTNAQLVAYEVANWKNSVKDTLPLGQASIFTPTAEDEATAGQRRQLGIMIAWRENERDNDPSYKNAIDATKAYNNAGDLVTAGRDEPTNICPTGATCHLQYIPVAARCAPYSPGGATSTFYCPGS